MSKIVVVGAVAGGATVASQIRRLDKESEIIVFEKDRDMSFANCALPYYIGNVVTSRELVLEATPEQFYDSKQIKVKPYHEVTAVNTTENRINVYDRKAKQSYSVEYDKLILSPGCSANQLNLNSSISFTLRNMEDTDAIYQFIEDHHVQNALIIGAGYISLEVLDNLYERNIQPTLIHRSEHVNKLMDSDMNQPIFEEMDKRDISYYLNEEVIKVDGNDIHFKSGEVKKFDLIIEGVGVQPNSAFLQSSKIQLDAHGYIPVNDKFQTNISNVYALGDIITSHYRHVDFPAHVPLAWGAHRGASIIAEQIAGNNNIQFKGYLGSNIVKFFDYTFASVGVSPSELTHFNYKMVEVYQNDHAGYYPNNHKLHLCVYFDSNNRQILRAAAVGKSGVDKRIDVLSMAMMHQSTIDDLTDFEVAYAPPYSRPKDIINMIGYKARNL
ncbi:CoA-disulfide reductase [Staphylococcus gallinarum]|uniref:CoA-disulfide reductase n=1 Tax=Staphylococcus gallinarum TaxID=1293 RepID=A0A3A0W367_STAGA|nr:CoA-disulfide reductase [Staphylococcus gallinarum]RIP35771.1 CoA-disulfide reductase [Staphylococcus gallinarum]